MNLRAQLAELTQKIFCENAAAVERGPFKGMTLLESCVWGDGDLLQRLLCTYEMELWPAIERVIADRPDVIVNVGCAEGYYAVGFALRLPDTPVHAFDSDANALRVSEASALANRAERNLRLEIGSSTAAVASAMRGSRRPFLFVDCEGCEVELFGQLGSTDLERCSMIVECHDFAQRDCSKHLFEKFSSTHVVQRIEQGSRNPHDFPLLRGLHEDVRWLAMSEKRPETMCWLFATPRSRGDRE